MGPGNVRTDPAFAELAALAHILDRSILDWRPADPPPGIVIYHRPDPDRCMIVRATNGSYTMVAAPGGDQRPVSIAPVGAPHEAAARIARGFGVAGEPSPGADHQITVAPVLDGTTCTFTDCGRSAFVSVALAWDWIEFRCPVHWPETRAGLIRRGHELIPYDSTDHSTDHSAGDSSGAGTGAG